MKMTNKKQRTPKTESPSLILAIFVILVIAVILTTGIVNGISVIPLLVINILLVTIISVLAGYSYTKVEEGMMDGVKQAVGSVLILAFVGVLIAGWILCGTVPMIVRYGLDFATPGNFLPFTFILCSIISLCTGSSWGTAGTVGIACASIGVSIGLPLPVVAGAAISGSVLGDKLSPISDSTILAASASKTHLFYHVRSMLYSTAPTFLLTLLIFWFMGMHYSSVTINSDTIVQVQSTLDSCFRFHWILLLPLAAILIMSLMKCPAMPTILISGFMALALAVFVQGVSVQAAITASYSGVSFDTGVAIVDTLLNKGGISSMLSTICTAILALSLGGILNKVGYLHVLVYAIAGKIKSERGTVLASLLSGALTLCLVANFYVSVVLAADMFGEVYDEKKIHRSVLSRTLEEANTVMLPIVPWNSSAIYYTSLFGFASSFEFAPYMIFAHVGTILAIIFAATGLFIFRQKEDHPSETEWNWRNDYSK